MTLPKLLQEKRDELYDQHLEDKDCTCDENEYGCAYRDESFDFKSGFDSACDLLIPEIEKLHNMLWETRNDMVLIHNLLLDYYSEENVYFHNPEYAFNKAKESLVRLKALNSWQEFLGEKSEEK